MPTNCSAGYDLVLDGTDNFDTRRFVAEACARARVPLVSGAVSMWDGQVTVFMPGGRSFTDLYPVTPDAADLPSCEVVGVLGADYRRHRHADGDGSDQADHRRRRTAAGRLLLYDGRAARFTELEY